MDNKIKDNKTQDVPKKQMPLRILYFFRRFFIQTVIIVLLVLAFGFFELGRYTVYSAHPSLYAQARAEQTLKKVSKLIQLPKGTPTMAIINNATSVKKTQPFLIHANDGDVLIVYQSAGEAILYRPSNNKLISVGPIYKSHGTSKDTQKIQPATGTGAVSSQSKSAQVTKKQAVQNATTSTSSK